MNERILNMKDSIDTLNDAGVRRTLFYPLAYESLISTRGESTEIRRAKAQAHIMDSTPLVVLPYELIAGTIIGLCPLEKNVLTKVEQRKKAHQVISEYLDIRSGTEQREKTNRHAIKTFEADFTSKKSRWALMSRVYHDASISYADLQSLIDDMEEEFSSAAELEKYEIGRELERSFKIDYGTKVKHEIDSLPWFAANHLSLNYGALMNKGFSKRVREIEQLKAEADGEHVAYYEAALITARAASRFFKRYADELKKESESQPESRKSELVEMANICRRLAEEPAETFREGVQFVWLLHIIASVLWGSALSFGRFDQYMYPLFNKDIEAGNITYDEAKEILCCMWLKVNEPCMRTVQSMTIGGITPDGLDAANGLTKLCLDVVQETKLPYPNVGVRIHDKNPEWLMDVVVESVKQGSGQPMIMADSVWIENLKRLGYDEKYANDYYNMGCVEIMIPGKQPNWGVTDPIAFPMLFENVFRKFTDKEISLETFADFKNAYMKELYAAVDADKKEADNKLKDIKGKCYDPFASLMIDGCIEKGSDMFQGGSELGTHWSFYAYGLGTATDVMASVKRFVYDERKFTILEMAEMLEKNFEGYEDMRMILDQKSPHYGNDDDEADIHANEILRSFNTAVYALNDLKSENKYVSTLFGYFFHIYHGEITGATANGRKRGDAFSDSMGPSQGKDVSGPTKMLNSVLKLEHQHVTGGYALNLKINPDLVKGETGTSALKMLLKAYIDSGGPQVQVNFVDAEVLKKAKKSPEKHRDLIVRIGGYCEYFVNLDGALQDEIIQRTVHGI